MQRFARRRPLASLLTCAALLQTGTAGAEPVTVRRTEGVVHGFLVLRTLQGNTLAGGELSQFARGDQVTSRLAFRFKDGSIHDETAVYSQRGSFRLVSDHLVQKGPAFPRPLDVSIDGPGSVVTVRYTGEDSKEKVTTERTKLPLDVANGLMLTLLKNIGPEAPQATVSMVAFTPKPRLVKLVISIAGKEPFLAAGVTHQAIHYVLKAEIGGVASVIAPLLGKQPPDNHVWILGGVAPGFVKSEGPLYVGGPPWRIELASPIWPEMPAAAERH